jgi:putative NADH-flavin reductase
MKHVALVGASGGAGSRILQELVRRGVLLFSVKKVTVGERALA